MHLLNVSNGTPLINTRLNTTNGYLAQWILLNQYKLATCTFFLYFVHFILGISIFKSVTDQFEWMFSGVYGLNLDSDRFQLWEVLVSVFSWWELNTRLNTTNGYLAQWILLNQYKLATCTFFLYFVHFILVISIFKSVTNQFEWMFSGVYGLNLDSDRFQQWEVLVSVFSWWELKW